MIRSRAAVAWAPGQPLDVTEIEVAPPKHGEVLLKIVASGVCHTDAYTLSGADPEGLFPAVLGHEAPDCHQRDYPMCDNGRRVMEPLRP